MPKTEEPGPAAEEVALPLTGQLDVDQLERDLWSDADILRGSIDRSDYKDDIFGLLFLKRLSDRFEEEAEKLIAEGVSNEAAWTDPDEHQFFVPDRALALKSLSAGVRSGRSRRMSRWATPRYSICSAIPGKDSQ